MAAVFLVHCRALLPSSERSESEHADWRGKKQSAESLVAGVSDGAAKGSLGLLKVIFYFGPFLSVFWGFCFFLGFLSKS